MRELVQRHPIALVNSVNPFRLEGQKTASFEIVDEIGEIDALCIPVGNAGNITAYWKGFTEAGATRPRMLGYQAEGAAPLVDGAPVENPETVASAIRIGNPARWEEAMARDDRLAGRRSAPSPTPRSSTPTAGWPRTRACSASRPRRRAWRGCCKHGAEGAARIVCVLTGHGLKDPQVALGHAGSVVPCEPEIDAVEKAVLGVVRRRRRIRVPASSANLGPGFDVLAAALAHAHRGRGGGDRALRASSPTSRSPATAATSSCAASPACTPPDDFEFRIASDVPLSGGLGTSAAAYVAGLLAADSIFELDADILALATELEGHPDNVAAALLGGIVLCADGEATRFDPPAGLEAVLVVPHRRVRTAKARAALPAEVPMADAVFNVAHASPARARARPGPPRPRRPRPRRPPAPAAPRRAVPRVDGAASARAPEFGALGATISGAGPTVLVWSQYDATAGVVERLRAETGGLGGRPARAVRAAGRGRAGAGLGLELRIEERVRSARRHFGRVWSVEAISSPR